MFCERGFGITDAFRQQNPKGWLSTEFSVPPNSTHPQAQSRSVQFEVLWLLRECQVCIQKVSELLLALQKGFV